MSKTKKVLSLVMAVALLFNVLGIVSSAACASDKVLGFTAETTDTLVAGGQVTVDFYVELPAGTDYANYRLGLFQLVVSYDASILTPVSRTWSDTYAEFMLDSNGFNTNSTTVHGWVSSKFTAEEAAIYTGSCAVAGASLDLSNAYGYTGTAGYSIKGLKDKMFSITFDVAADYDGTSEAEVAILKNSFQNATRCYYRDITTVGNKIAKDGSQGDFTESAVAVTAPVATSPVYHVANQVRPNGDAMDIGIKAGFNTADIAIAFDANGTSTNVAKVGANLKINGVDAGTGTQRFVYKISDTEYQYRVIIEGVAKDSTDVYTVELFVEMNDGTIITGDTVTVTAADVVGKLPA